MSEVFVCEALLRSNATTAFIIDELSKFGIIQDDRRNSFGDYFVTFSTIKSSDDAVNELGPLYTYGYPFLVELSETSVDYRNNRGIPQPQAFPTKGKCWLERMGWKHGEGCGKGGKGIKEPIKENPLNAFVKQSDIEKLKQENMFLLKDREQLAEQLQYQPKRCCWCGDREQSWRKQGRNAKCFSLCRRRHWGGAYCNGLRVHGRQHTHLRSA